MLNRHSLVLWMFLIPTLGFAQLGGQRAFEYLNIPGNARLAALGGANITSGWLDPAMVNSNPALLNPEWDKQLVLNRLGYFADIGQTSLVYARELKSGSWAAGVSYLDYGDIQSFDNEGFLNGEFTIAEYAFTLSHSRAFGPFRAGATARLAVSDLAGFQASAFLMDFGGLFKHPEKDLTVGMMIRNLGVLLSDYTDDNNSQLPLDVQLGVTYKPQFMPFRFSLTARNLNRSDVVFFDPAGNSLIGQNEQPGVSEEIFRRLVFGTELIFSPNFQFRFGYNHLLRQELRLADASGGAGFSFGFMLKIKRMEFSYARSLYHTAGGSNTLQLAINTSGLIKRKKQMLDNNYLTPKQIVSELDKYIIGQADAKKNVAIALRNRWRRMHVKTDMQREIVPNNILMIGATGVGKTEIARRLAKIADAPFTKVEASKFTEVGYVGRDVESMVRDLVEQSVNLVRQSKKDSVKEKAEQAVEDLILDALIPPVRHSPKATAGFQTEEEDAAKMSDAELNEKTRERFREKIRTGEIDDRKIEISVQAAAGGGGMIGGGMMDEVSMINLQDMLSNMMPKKSKKRKVTIGEAKKLLLEEESAKLIDMDEVKDEAIKKAENTGIIFIDEIDKIAGGSSKSGGSGPDVSREGVQRDLLPIVEGSAVSTKYGVINTDHILFVAAGAFHVAKPSDLIPELQGRFPIRVELNNLTRDDFYQILKEPKNALTKQYEALLGSEDVSLEFTDDSLQELADLAFRINEEVENIGARRLHTVMSQLLNDILFDVPDVIPQNARVSITKELVQERLSGLVQNKDLSEFIL